MFCNHKHPAIAFIGSDCPICIVRAAPGVTLGSSLIEVLKKRLSGELHELPLNEFSTRLTSAQVERLALVAEEMGEAIQMIGKTLRHGLDSSHPDYENQTNRRLLEKEVGHVYAGLDLLIDADLSAHNVEVSRQAKRTNVKPYLHFQE